jgi:hypothetical protein
MIRCALTLQSQNEAWGTRKGTYPRDPTDTQPRVVGAVETARTGAGRNGLNLDRASYRRRRARSGGCISGLPTARGRVPGPTTQIATPSAPAGGTRAQP